MSKIVTTIIATILLTSVVIGIIKLDRADVIMDKICNFLANKILGRILILFFITLAILSFFITP